MRKLVLLMLVLGIASVASAGLALSVNGGPAPAEITLEPSDTIVLDVHATPGFGLGDFQISLSNAQGSLDASQVVFSEAYTTMYIPAYGPITSAWGLAWANVGHLQDGPQHFSLGGGNLPPAATLYDELIMDGLVFHCEEPTDVIITLEEYMGAGQFSLLQTIIVHQIPEPITMGLLGLGGLFLRRRK